MTEPDPRLALLSRGDPLTAYLHAALARRYPIAAEIDVELHGVRRAAVAAVTVRPTWQRWAARYMKSNLGFAARSELAGRALSRLGGGYDLAVQTHTLFRAPSRATVVYVDCTYREAMSGWPEWAPLRGRARFRWLAAEKRIYDEAAHIFVFTTRSHDSLLEHYGVPADKITIVGSGVNFVDDPSMLQHEGTPSGRTILFVGKEFERKGGPLVLNAFEQIRAEFPDARLVMVGTRVTGSVPDGVEILGVVDDRARMDELYSRSDVFCLASLFDPAPMVVLEAMGHGLPCVLSRGASAHVASLVEDGSGGWLAETGDAAGLAAGLRAYLADPVLARRVGSTAQGVMAERYTWDSVVERMAPALEQVWRQRREEPSRSRR